jgi:hypothetical protein
MSQSRPPTVKQQRTEKRAAQVEALRRKEAARRRNRVIGTVVSIVAILAVIGVVVTIIVINAQPKAVPVGLEVYENLESGHVEGDVKYEVIPPVGGPHNPAWLNCAVYDEPQVDEHAVHSLEHGAIWITYDPAETSDDELEALRELTPATYAILSPYPGIGPAMAISAWGAQLRFTDPADPAVQDFIDTYKESASSPEPGAPCTGAVDGPGKVS